jgi:hypothetical protein
VHVCLLALSYLPCKLRKAKWHVCGTGIFLTTCTCCLCTAGRPNSQRLLQLQALSQVSSREPASATV